MSIGIYRLVAPDGSVYVGQSTNLEQRQKAYRAGNCRDMPKLHCSFLKYGAINHKFEILALLESKDPYELCVLEQFYITHFRQIGANLLNTNNVLRAKYPENHYFKSRSYEKTEEHKINIGNSNRGKKRTPEQCRKNGLAKKGQYPASAKRVIDLSTMTIYPSARVAAELFGYRHSTLKAMLNGQRKNKTTFIYENRGNNSSDE